MIEVRIPKEISEYKEKIIFGLSGRQLICSIIAVLMAIGVFCSTVFVLHIPVEFASYLVILAALPPLSIGFIKKNGLPFEKIFVLWWKHFFGHNKRYYATKKGENEIANLYDKSKGRKSEKRSEVTEEYYIPSASEHFFKLFKCRAASRKAAKGIRRSKQATAKET